MNEKLKRLLSWIGCLRDTKEEEEPFSEYNEDDPPRYETAAEQERKNREAQNAEYLFGGIYFPWII